MPAIDTTANPSVDEARLELFFQRFFADLGAVMHAATVLIGDRVGLYKAMADSRWCMPDEIAERTGTDLRYVREWLAGQAASGYVEYDAATGRFRLSPEQALTLTSEDNPMYAPAGLQAAAAMLADVGLVADAFRTGRGIVWLPLRS